ncbi:NAD-dependent deacylase [Pseudoponticoccus marisrubri]|uniref:NAD-dependent protein deacylase n=1 Tax=Pseudoponticoccus marisrubri TaxID=1685382 RepID=A0A0W7WNQ3_9RHOB|nr:NAD-dependent deacylase [Pseudoponticoccus marisrubri]KUF12188.1 NAD-dependent deacylase [Pseudoponticoccus marisrubri]
MTEKIVILTGAGLSAESGLSTFRDAGGLWAQHRIEDVATPEAFARDPARVQAFYNMRRAQAAEAHPNAAHLALARLQTTLKGRVILITQNVDWLHEKAGGIALHMHGVLSQALCAACGHRWYVPDEMTPDEPCPACGAPRGRPDVVWFGEMPYHLDLIDSHLSSCTLFAAIGTSGQVFPAAGFVREAQLNGAETVELNLERTEISGQFQRNIFGPATETVPRWVDSLLEDSLY